MFKFAAIAVFCFVANLSAADSIDGLWKGEYSYPGGGQAVAFTFIVKSNDESLAFKGRTQEPNTFGNKDALTLEADVLGLVEANTVRFVKKYDGKGGQKHEVWYTGTLSSDGKTITGRWYIKENFAGDFVLRR